MRHVSTGTDFVHDLFGVIVVQTRLLVLDIHAVVVIGRAVELEEFFFVDDCLDETGIDEVVGEIIVEAAVLVVFGFLADTGLDGVLMNVAEDDQELVVGEDGPAFEGGLEEASDALVLIVEIVHIAGRDVLENAAEGHGADLDDKVDVVVHQAVTEELEVADGLVFAEDFQKLFKVFFGFEDILLVDAAHGDVVDTGRGDFAFRCHRCALFNLSLRLEMIEMRLKTVVIEMCRQPCVWVI